MSRAPGPPAPSDRSGELRDIAEVSTPEGERLLAQLADDAERHGDRLLQVRDLSTYFFTPAGVVHAVDGVSFDLDYGETLGLVGESGSGKTVTALSLARLVAEPPGRIVDGAVVFDGIDLLQLSKEEMRLVRGRKVGFIFQDPMTSLNPTLTVGRQIGESARTHLGLSRQAAARHAADLLGTVGIPRARDRLGDYPHQFSGGMRQRVMIAIALACQPMLLIADEPTTALDVTIQAQIMELLRSLSVEFRTAVILITHDLGLAAGMCQRVSVMYAGRIVESGAVDDIFERPRMPYTAALLDSRARLDTEPGGRLRTIEGVPPDLLDPAPECRFAPRCPHRREPCTVREPALTPRPSAGEGHAARCWGTEPGGWIP
jgi:oligopeptide transport system ATP-binding protein